MEPPEEEGLKRLVFRSAGFCCRGGSVHQVVVAWSPTGKAQFPVVVGQNNFNRTIAWPYEILSLYLVLPPSRNVDMAIIPAQRDHIVQAERVA